MNPRPARGAILPAAGDVQAPGSKRPAPGPSARGPPRPRGCGRPRPTDWSARYRPAARVPSLGPAGASRSRDDRLAGGDGRRRLDERRRLVARQILLDEPGAGLRVGELPQAPAGALHDAGVDGELDRLADSELRRLVARDAGLELEDPVDLDELVGVPAQPHRVDGLGGGDAREHLAALHRHDAHAHGDDIAPVLGVAADAEIAGADAAGDGVGVVGQDAALEEEAREADRRHRLGVVALELLPGGADELALLQQVGEAAALNHREPAAAAGPPQRVDDEGAAALRDRARVLGIVVVRLVLPGKVGEAVDGDVERPRRRRQRLEVEPRRGRWRHRRRLFERLAHPWRAARGAQGRDQNEAGKELG